MGINKNKKKINLKKDCKEMGQEKRWGKDMEC